jgi:tetratricopeptide (TPR) repeat protein
MYFLLVIFTLGMSAVLSAAGATEARSGFEPKLPSLPKNTPVLVDRIVRDAYQKCLSNSSSAIAWGEYGKTLLMNGYKHDSVYAFQGAYRLDDKNYRWPYLIAYALIDDSAEEALKFVTEAAGLNNQSIDVMFLQARAYEAVGEIEKAVALLTQVVKRAPNDAAVNYLLGQLLLALRRYQESKPYLLKAMRLSPASAKTRASLLSLSNFTDIEKQLIPAADKVNSDRDITFASKLVNEMLPLSRLPWSIGIMANRYMHQKNWQAAETRFGMLEEYYDIKPADLANYAVVLTVLQKYELAEEKYKIAIKQAPKELSYRLGLADLLFLNRKPEAKSRYQWLLSNSVSDEYKSEGLQGLGRIAASKGDLKKGLQLLTQATKLNSKSADMQMDLVRIYADMKQFDKAYDHLANAERLGMKVDGQFKMMLDRAREQAYQ